MPCETLTLGGRDRERLLHGLVSCDIRGLTPGEARHGFFTHNKGGILADFLLFAGADEFLLFLPHGTAATIATHLEKYKLAADVTLQELTELPVLEWCRSSAEPPAVDAAADATIEVFRSPRSSANRLLLLPKASGRTADSASWLRNTTDRLGIELVGPEVRELARIEDGELRFGIDFDGNNFPQETGREDAVSYTKGCFLGQEVVARIHYRGGVQRLPVGLAFEGDALPEAGVELLLEGRPVGRATSIVLSPNYGTIGLAIVHKRGAEAGTRLELAGGGAAIVVSLPF